MTAHQEPEAPNKTGLRPGGPNSKGLFCNRPRTKSSISLVRPIPARPISFPWRSVPVLSLKGNWLRNRVGPVPGVRSRVYKRCAPAGRPPGYVAGGCG